jgi:hypothetical protein
MYEGVDETSTGLCSSSFKPRGIKPLEKLLDSAAADIADGRVVIFTCPTGAYASVNAAERLGQALDMWPIHHGLMKYCKNN